MEGGLAVSREGDDVDGNPFAGELLQSSLQLADHPLRRREVSNSFDDFHCRMLCPAALTVAAVERANLLTEAQEVDPQRAAQPTGDKRAIDQLLLHQQTTANILIHLGFLSPHTCPRSVP